ncbi:hypothetical protein COOONC_05287 [Cooperia oncophora]
MNSIAGSVEAEDWLDISDSLSLPSLSLDDVLNEVSQLDDELLDGHLSGSVDHISPPPSAAASYKLDSAVKTETIRSRVTGYSKTPANSFTIRYLTNWSLSDRKHGSAVAVAYHGGYTAIATSKGSLLLFDAEGRLERFRHGGELDGSASCVAFSSGGGHIAVGYSKGFVKIINTKSGAVEQLIQDAVQIGRGVLEILYIGSRRTILTLDSGGSVFEIQILQKFRLAGKSRGLTTGGNVSPAMQCLAERACYQSLCRKGSSDCLIALSHDELFELTLISEDDQLVVVQIQEVKLRLPAYYLLDIHRGRIRAEQKFLDRLPNLLTEQMRRLVDLAMSGCKEGKVSDLIAHYKFSFLISIGYMQDSGVANNSNNRRASCLFAFRHKFNSSLNWAVLVHGCMIFSITKYGQGDKVERDMLSRYIFLESLDEFVLDGTLESPPPALVSAYITHLASEGHFSQLQASVVRFPIQSIDLHYVMSTCKQNGLYDGIIYVMNKALGDYLSPLEEMLADVSSFASNEVLSDSEVERGNRLLLYLHCCLAGHAYPYGTLPPEQLATVPVQVYRCITSLKGKDGVSSDVSYPYLRLLLLFDAQQFTHVIRTCADAPIFQSEGRLQRLVENIGRLSMELRNESALVHFLLLISQLVDITGVVTPVEIVEDVSLEYVVITLMRMKWQHSSAEFAIVETLRAVPQIDRKAVLRMASSPMRKEICTFIYCAERKFVDLINCYIRDAENEGIFSVIRRILRSDLTQQEYQEVSEVVCQLIPRLAAVNARECADLVIDCFPNYLLNLRSHTTEERMASYQLLKAAFDIKRERQENFLQMDEDVEEHLFGIVFEGLVRERVESLDSTLQVNIEFRTAFLVAW